MLITAYPKKRSLPDKLNSVKCKIFLSIIKNIKMKKQLIKTLSAFIIIMMVSASILQAQCTGNRVRICKTVRVGCVYQCVKKGDVQKYLNMGWGLLCQCTFPFAKNSIQISKKPPVRLPVNKAMLSGK